MPGVRRSRGLWRWLGWMLSCALAAVTPGVARANGRFPTADYLVVGPGSASDLIALRTTFGIVVSRDHGHTWRWICEDAYGGAGMADPSAAIGMDGTLILGLTGVMMDVGITTSRSLCTWAHPMGD